MTSRKLGLAALLLLAPLAAARAAAIEVHAGPLTYLVDSATLRVDLRDGDATPVPLLKGQAAVDESPVSAGAGVWSWTMRDGLQVRVSTQGRALTIAVTGAEGARWQAAMPEVSSGTWLVPDGEGMAFGVADGVWRAAFGREHCLGGTTDLSFPAWTLLDGARAVTYALDDGFQSQLCLHDTDGLQTRLTHQFAEGARTVLLMIEPGEPDPLAPALFYRRYLQQQGRLRSFADKQVPGLDRLFGAPHLYVWGDGRDLAFLDELKAAGIGRAVISYDQDPKTQKHLVRSAYLKRARELGYLAGPYDAFDNGQPDDTADMPAAIWGPALYPSGCLRDRRGAVVPGFANRGCQMSSDAIARHPGGFVPAQRYAAHVEEGANQVFIDVDAFGVFYEDFTPGRRMTKAQDRSNVLARLALGIRRYGLVLGSENVTAWSADVAHYSHGTGLAHMAAVWPLLSDARFNGYWPPERPPLFFKRFTPTAQEARALFGPGDRLPLFEAVYHDAVVAVDRWEFGLMKVAGQEARRYARALLFGIPTMWNLDRRDLAAHGAWLRAAHDDFQAVHGVSAPVALTAFAWLTPDRQVQQVRYADGRVATANFGDVDWQGLKPNCVRLARGATAARVFCPPAASPNPG
ncbi:glycoside hydrolase [Pelomonas cellulosilytica]|uniref:Glycoside hydrolase n=1 Tax=Pelomonas cellulosilytica TaxID=2906762 RepID=A0ABS8XUB3_9BURK|nr:glycoside hydrolase [Pelomonas sp. P8]MCE4554294.1 glycoside hydrolase [Pelomonas sp. P8]